MHSINMNGVNSSVRCCTSGNQAVIIAAGFVLLMSDPLRTDGTRAHDTAPAPDRDAKIEQLLLLGLDHYFAARYELAINVWTRALFLDRAHPRARAYIERARSALAERQRESEELLQNGVAAFQRGDADEARRLLRAAIEGGAPSEEALAVLERLNRLDAPAIPAAPPVNSGVPRRRAPLGAVVAGPGLHGVALAGIIAIVVGAGGYATWSQRVDWRLFAATLRSALPTDTPVARAALPVTREITLPVPRRGEETLARARSLAASGHLREALAVLDDLRATDPQKADGDRLRGDIQQQLLALSSVVPVAAPDRDKGERPRP
jgi:tetratricopeptide (TPR) repeat protein